MTVKPAFTYYEAALARDALRTVLEKLPAKYAPQSLPGRVLRSALLKLEREVERATRLKP